MIRVAPLGVLVLVGCVASQPVLKPLTGDDVTIFVHGYRASFLATESGELAYVTISQGLSAGDRSLALPFEGQREFPKYGPLHVVGPLTRLTVVPGLLEEDPYGSWMEWASDALPGFQIYAYDWRADLRESGRGLCTFIERLGPQRRVRIVAHSMGGLVTLHCLQSGSDTVRAMVKKVVFAGSPLRGGAGQWDDLHLGTVTQSNTRLIDAEALLTFAASWQLLPPKPDFFVDANGAPVEVAGYEAQTWVDRKWGVFAQPVPDAYRAQLEARLASNRESWEVLHSTPSAAPGWESMVIIGSGRPCQVGWRVKGESFDFGSPVKGDCDGTVSVTSAQPFPWMHAKVVQTTAEHSGMLRVREVQAVIADFLR